MSNLEQSVKELAIALDDLGSKVEQRQETINHLTERAGVTKQQISAAQKHTNDAARELSSVIQELKDIAALAAPAADKS